MEEQLKDIVERFVNKHEITCAESIYQDDEVIANSYQLMEELIQVVGYFVYEGDE